MKPTLEAVRQTFIQFANAGPVLKGCLEKLKVPISSTKHENEIDELRLECYYITHFLQDFLRSQLRTYQNILTNFGLKIKDKVIKNIVDFDTLGKLKVRLSVLKSKVCNLFDKLSIKQSRTRNTMRIWGLATSVLTVASLTTGIVLCCTGVGIPLGIATGVSAVASLGTLPSFVEAQLEYNSIGEIKTRVQSLNDEVTNVRNKLAAVKDCEDDILFYIESDDEIFKGYVEKICTQMKSTLKTLET